MDSLYRIHVKYKRGFTIFYVFRAPSPEAAVERAKADAKHKGRAWVEFASVVDADAVTQAQQEEQDRDKPYMLDLHGVEGSMNPEDWAKHTKRVADDMARDMNNGAFVSMEDRVHLARAKRAAQIRNDPGQLKPHEREGAVNRAVILGEDEPLPAPTAPGKAHADEDDVRAKLEEEKEKAARTGDESMKKLLTSIEEQM